MQRSISWPRGPARAARTVGDGASTAVSFSVRASYRPRRVARWFGARGCSHAILCHPPKASFSDEKSSPFGEFRRTHDVQHGARRAGDGARQPSATTGKGGIHRLARRPAWPAPSHQGCRSAAGEPRGVQLERGAGRVAYGQRKAAGTAGIPGEPIRGGVGPPAPDARRSQRRRVRRRERRRPYPGAAPVAPRRAAQRGVRSGVERTVRHFLLPAG